MLDRWILSRTAGLAAGVERALGEFDARTAAELVGNHIEALSTWYLRRSRRRFSRHAAAGDRAAAFATLHEALVQLARIAAPILPFLSEQLYQELALAADPSVPESVHLTRWPGPELAAARDEGLEAAMATLLRAVELGRTLRAQAGIRTRQPLARLWLAIPGGELLERDALLALVAEELNVKRVELIGDESELVERRVKPLLPRIGRRLGPATRQVLDAARANAFEILSDGSVRLGGVTLAPDEVEILAAPRAGTAVAHDEGLVVVIDTNLDAALRAEGDARELQRAVQDLRREAALALDDRIELWLELHPQVHARLAPHLDGVRDETLVDELHLGAPPDGLAAAEVDLDGSPVRLALRRVEGEGATR